MEYQISKILHSGEKGTRGTPKEAEDDLNRISRILDVPDVDLDTLKYIINVFGLQYVLDENGNDFSHKLLMPSRIQNIESQNGGEIIIMETMNSIYYLEKVG